MQAVLIAVALLFPAAQQAERNQVFEKDIAAAIAKLDSDRYTENEAAKRELVDIGRRAVPALVKALHAADPAPSVQLRRTVCEILGKIRHNSDEAVTALIGRLKDYEEFGTSVAAAAAEALGNLGDDRAVAPLVEALKSREADTDKRLKYNCIRALGMFRANEAVDALIPALKDNKKTSDDEWGRVISVAAAEALGRIRAQGAAEALGDVLNQENVVDPFSEKSLALYAAQALEKILGESKGDLYGEPAKVMEALAEWRNWHGVRVTKRRLAEYAKAVEAFHKDQGRYPKILNELKEKPGDAKSWPDDGYVKDDPVDGWNARLKYQVPGTGAAFDLFSEGSDRQPGGTGFEEDLWNHDSWKPARIEATRTKIQEIAGAVRKFHADHKRYPGMLSDLVHRPAYAAVEKWPKEPYLKSLPKDAFGNSFTFAAPGTGGEPFDIISYGQDRKPGGEGINADIWNHDKRPEKK